MQPAPEWLPVLTLLRNVRASRTVNAANDIEELRCVPLQVLAFQAELATLPPDLFPISAIPPARQQVQRLAILCEGTLVLDDDFKQPLGLRESRRPRKRARRVVDCNVCRARGPIRVELCPASHRVGPLHRRDVRLHSRKPRGELVFESFDRPPEELYVAFRVVEVDVTRLEYGGGETAIGPRGIFAQDFFAKAKCLRRPLKLRMPVSAQLTSPFALVDLPVHCAETLNLAK